MGLMVDFYINTYLLRQEPWDMERGCIEIDMFLGYFFIRKCMLEHGYIEKNDYDFVCLEIKENMKEWQEDCARFNSGDFYY